MEVQIRSILIEGSDRWLRFGRRCRYNFEMFAKRNMCLFSVFLRLCQSRLTLRYGRSIRTYIVLDDKIARQKVVHPVRTGAVLTRVTATGRLPQPNLASYGHRTFAAPRRRQRARFFSPNHRTGLPRNDRPLTIYHRIMLNQSSLDTWTSEIFCSRPPAEFAKTNWTASIIYFTRRSYHNSPIYPHRHGRSFPVPNNIRPFQLYPRNAHGP